tara:strand:- start:6297 stop:7055 length:759 start_codon:yes stop_codon:yes gene_type:complete
MNDVAIIGDTGLLGTSIKKKIETNHYFNTNNINLFDPDVCVSFPQVDNIIFLAGDPRIFYYRNKPGLCFKNNYELIKNILNKKTKNFIYISSVCVYKDISNYSKNNSTGWNDYSKFYGISKLFSEYEIISKLDNYCIIRLSTPVNQNMLKGPLFDLKINKSYTSENSEYSFIHTDDVTNAIVHIIENQLNGVFNLTANKSIPLDSFIDDIGSIKFLSKDVIKYDSDNISLCSTGWHPQVNIIEWFYNKYNPR